MSLDNTAKLVEVMHREKYKEFRGSAVDYPIAGKPILVGGLPMVSFETITVVPENDNVWHYGFAWNGEIYLIPERPIKTIIPLYGEIGQRNAKEAFETVMEICDSPIVAGKAFVLNEELFGHFRDRFEKNIKDFSRQQFWMDDVYDKEFEHNKGCRHCTRRVLGTRFFDCGIIRDFPLEITERGSFYGAYPLLILAKLPFDTMVYTDGKAKEPLRIVPEGCLHSPK